MDVHIPQRTLHDLGWPRVLEAVAARTQTARGRERALALPFLDRQDAIEGSLARVEEVRRLLRQELEIPVSGAEDVRDVLDRAAKGAMLEPLELLACARTIRAATRVRSFLAGRRGEVPILALAGEALPDAAHLAQRIETAFEPSGRLRDSASAALQSLRERARSLHHQIKGRLDEMLEDLQFESYLRDRYYSVRNDRYVVPVNASFRAKVPGIVHNASNSGQTIFVEPEQLVGLGNELSIAESLALEEERRVLQELSGDLGDRAGELSQAVDVLAELDVAAASGRLAQDLDATAPRLVVGRDPFALLDARHPLLVLQGKRVVANDVSLRGPQRALVISGPNAGGKTVTLTTVGLCALLARAGLPVPAAAGSTVPLYRRVESAVGDAQDLARDLSTFSAHLGTLKAILAGAGEGSLVLIDEIAADTDPREGAALASAVMRELVDAGAQVLVTTHLEELKAIGLTEERFGNARVGLDPRSLTPTFQLELGAAGVSSALEIAARVGLPPSVIEKARSSLQGGSALGAALEKLEGERLALERERTRIEEERASHERARRELERQRAEAEAARREAEARVREELRAEVERTREELGQLVARLTARPNLTEAVREQGRLKERSEQLAREVARSSARGEAARGEAAPPAKLVPGTRVKVVPLGREAEVVELSAEDALVAMGPMKTRVKLADLVPLAGTPKGPKPAFRSEKSRRAERAAAAAPAAVTAREVQVDVRGLRAEDAVREVELFLDRSYGEGQDAVRILHGHGTGALKKTLREALEGSPYVASFRGGEAHEGGDGVTIVQMRG